MLPGMLQFEGFWNFVSSSQRDRAMYTMHEMNSKTRGS